MSQISQSLDSLVAKNQAAIQQQPQRPSAQTQSSGGGFGSAVNVTLSAGAQAAVASQSSASGASANASPSAGGGAPSVPLSASSSTSSDVELLIEEAKQQVIPEVGITGADEVVSDQGTIDEVKLNELLAEQATAKSVNIAA
jgi:hypothetical protein